MINIDDVNHAGSRMRNFGAQHRQKISSTSAAGVNERKKVRAFTVNHNIITASYLTQYHGANGGSRRDIYKRPRMRDRLRKRAFQEYKMVARARIHQQWLAMHFQTVVMKRAPNSRGGAPSKNTPKYCVFEVEHCTYVQDHCHAECVWLFYTCARGATLGVGYYLCQKSWVPFNY